LWTFGANFTILGGGGRTFGVDLYGPCLSRGELDVIMYVARLQYEFATRHQARCIRKTQLELNGAASGQLARTAYSLCTQTESRLSVIVCLSATAKISCITYKHTHTGHRPPTACDTRWPRGQTNRRDEESAPQPHTLTPTVDRRRGDACDRAFCEPTLHSLHVRKV
jgi:hypothetical protein